jgi:IclR family transcriptional regulator, pca regulon regulatory protein
MSNTGAHRFFRLDSQRRVLGEREARLAQRRRARHHNRRTRILGEPLSGRDTGTHNLDFHDPAADLAHPIDIELGRSLSDGLTMLSCFTVQRPELELEELAEQLQLSTAITELYVSTLIRAGYVEQDEEQRYRIGPTAVNLGRVFLEGLPIRRQSLPLLKQLRDQTGHTVSLALLDGAEILYITRVHGHRRGQYDADLNLRSKTRVKLQHTSAGRLLLAYLPEPERHAVSADLDLRPIGRGHRRALSKLHCELEHIRSAGFATTGAHPLEGVRTIAGPVRDRGGNAMAAIELTVPAPSYSSEQVVTQLGPPLARTCVQASASQP